LANKIDSNFKAASGRTSSGTIFKLIKTDGAVDLPPQAQSIIECFVRFGGDDFVLSVEDLVGKDSAGLESKLDEVGLETVQTPARIWSWYRGRLVKNGFIEKVS
tara:strand:- start:948 stop:1259 length:312 start_codon:yes stop_codon:yes gene_type:complete